MADLVNGRLLHIHPAILHIPADVFVNLIVIDTAVNRQNVLDVNRIGDWAEDGLEALPAIGNALDGSIGNFHSHFYPPDSEKGM